MPPASRQRTQWPVLGLAIAFALIAIIPGGWVLFWVFIGTALTLGSWQHAALALGGCAVVIGAMAYGLHWLGARLR